MALMYLLYSISLFHFYYKLLIKKVKQDRRKTLCSRQWNKQLVRKLPEKSFNKRLHNSRIWWFITKILISFSVLI